MYEDYEKSIKDPNYEQLVDWFHNEYIPNCLMKHNCQSCDPQKCFEELKLNQKKQCKHNVEFMDETIRDLEVYRYIPKGIIQYQCGICQAQYTEINTAKNKMIQNLLLLQSHFLFNQGQEIDCLFKLLNSKILLNAYKLSHKTQFKVMQFIKIWKYQQKNTQDALLFEKNFLQFTQICGMRNNDDKQKLKIHCNYKQYVDIEPSFIRLASLSENYLAYIVSSYYLHIYDIQKAEIILIKHIYSKKINQCLFTHDGKYLYLSFQNEISITLDVKSCFQKTKKKNFCQHDGKTENIQNLNYNQILVEIQNDTKRIKTYVHFDVKRNKIISVHKKISQYSVSQSSHDDKNNCILYLTQSKLLVFSIINRQVIFQIEVKNRRYISLFGENKILQLNKKGQMSISIINYEQQCLETHFFKGNVKILLCTGFQQFYYNQLDQIDKWNIETLSQGTIYSVEEHKNYYYKISNFNIILGNKFLINDDSGISIIKIGLRIIIRE